MRSKCYNRKRRLGLIGPGLCTPVFIVTAVRRFASFRDVKGIGKLAAVSTGPAPAVVNDVQFFKIDVHE